MSDEIFDLIIKRTNNYYNQHVNLRVVKADESCISKEQHIMLTIGDCLTPDGSRRCGNFIHLTKEDALKISNGLQEAVNEL